MKKNNQFVYLLAVFIAGAANLRAADSSSYNPFGVTAEAGTTGVGGSGSWRFMDNLGVRAGFDYLHYNYSHDIEDVNYNATLRLMTQPATLDIFPWASSSFRISVGAAFNQNKLSGTGNSTSGSYTLNGQTFTAAQVGTLNLNISQKPIDPYLSIGGNFFYFDSGHHVGLGGELGAFYTGKGRVSLTRTGGTANPAIDSALAGEQQKVQHYADKAIVWPVLKLQLNVTF